MNEDEAFIRAIVDGPGDDTPRLVYADWLDDRDDPRGPYLRAELEWAKLALRSRKRKPAETKLQSLAKQLDPVWVARVSRPPVGVCCERARFVGCGPLLTDADIDKAQSKFGVQFPEAYRAFLLNYNGGELVPSWGEEDDESEKIVFARIRTQSDSATVPSGMATPTVISLRRGLVHPSDYFGETTHGAIFPDCIPVGFKGEEFNGEYNCILLAVPKGHVFQYDNPIAQGNEDSIEEDCDPDDYRERIAMSFPKFLAELD